jgi:5'-phosphate synthase pdxT subunit
MSRIGVLGIQGAVAEHVEMMRSAGAESVKIIKYSHELNDVDGIILPGGESTAMAIAGTEVFPHLRQWVQQGKPIFGTCAGMILLSDHAIKQCEGGQALVGGLDVHVCRNYFGSQLQSKETNIDIMSASLSNIDILIKPSNQYRGVFIRAPAILKVGSDVTILSKMKAIPHKCAIEEIRKEFGENGGSDEYEIIIAVQQNNILATAFHPELTDDSRFHRYFLEMVNATKNK